MNGVRFALIVILAPYAVIAAFSFIIFNPEGLYLIPYALGSLLMLLSMAVYIGRISWLVAGPGVRTSAEKDEFEAKCDTRKLRIFLSLVFLLTGFASLLMVTPLELYISIFITLMTMNSFNLIRGLFGERIFRKPAKELL